MTQNYYCVKCFRTHYKGRSELYKQHVIYAVRENEKTHYWLFDKKRYNKRTNNYMGEFNSDFWNTTPIHLSWDGYLKMFHGKYTVNELKILKKHGLANGMNLVFVPDIKSASMSTIIKHAKIK